MRHAVDFHKDLVQVPFPVAMGAHRLDALGTDLGGKHRPEPVPPVTHGLMADFDPAFMQQIFDISKRQWEPDVEHHRQADDLGARLEVAEGGKFCHPGKLAGRPCRLKQSSFDNTSTGPIPKLST